METKKYFLILLVVTAILVLSPSSRQGQTQGQVEGTVIEDFRQFPEAGERHFFVPEPKPGIPDLVLAATAALVKDKASNIVLYQKNSAKPLPIASLTKLLTAIVVYKNTGFEEVVEIRPGDLEVPDYRAGLVPGERLLVIDLLRAMLISSSNDATIALARHTGGTVNKFVSMMNEEASALGMKAASFTNPVGFDDPNHYASAEDLAKLAEEFLNYPELVEIVGTDQATIQSLDGIVKHRLTTTNKLMLEHQEIIGLKTGYTTEAKGNLILFVDDPPGQYYLLVLGSADRERDAEQIFNWVKENFTWSWN